MAVFVMMEPDSFGSSRKALSDESPESYVDGRKLVRRPTRGVLLSKDTYSTIRVLRNGKPLPLLNSSGESAKSAMTANYLIQYVSESRQEKSQLLQTFGETYGFFFGEQPRILAVSGLLLNTPDFNWRAEWMRNYEEVFRATKLAEAGARMYLTFNDTVVEGYMLNTKVDTQAESPHHVSMSFSMWVTHQMELSDVGNTYFPRPQAVDFTKDGAVSSLKKKLTDKGVVYAAKAAAALEEEEFSQFKDSPDEYVAWEPSSYEVGGSQELRDAGYGAMNKEELARQIADRILSAKVIASRATTEVMRKVAAAVALKQNLGTRRERREMTSQLRAAQMDVLAAHRDKERMFGAYAMEEKALRSGI